jgi:hypothetical protein
MITIATSILTAPPDQSSSDALRKWAIDVLKSPENPPKLTDAAATQLYWETLPWVAFKSVDVAVDVEKLLEALKTRTHEWEDAPAITPAKP